MDIVLKLRELRRFSGLSQKEVALASGVGEKTLSTFESGQRIDSMKLEQLLQILEVYAMTPAEFFGGRVETEIFRELEGLTEVELQLVTRLRRLDPGPRQRLEDKFLAMLSAVEAVGNPALRAV
jgi:transcriptional regulator with XRE-family HTH domain